MIGFSQRYLNETPRREVVKDTAKSISPCTFTSEWVAGPNQASHHLISRTRDNFGESLPATCPLSHCWPPLACVTSGRWCATATTDR